MRGLIGALLAALAGYCLADAVEPEAGYTPVAPARVLHAALGAHLKQVRDWLADKDFASAAETSQGLAALAQLYVGHSPDPAWQKRTAALREACAKLLAAAKQQDAVACTRLVRECTDLLADLEKHPPTGLKVVDKDFKPVGTTKTWMQLLDGAYADAKAAGSVRELEDLALTLAEEVNAASHLRSDAKWRTMAVAVREAALTTAAKAKAKDLDAAKRDLKQVHQRCEACHQGYKK